MIAAIFTLITTLAGIAFYILKRNAKKKTPDEKYDADIEEFNENIANGDALGVSAQFEQLLREAKKRGDHSSGSGDKKPSER